MRFDRGTLRKLPTSEQPTAAQMSTAYLVLANELLAEGETPIDITLNSDGALRWNRHTREYEKRIAYQRGKVVRRRWSECPKNLRPSGLKPSETADGWTEDDLQQLRDPQQVQAIKLNVHSRAVGKNRSSVVQMGMIVTDYDGRKKKWSHHQWTNMGIESGGSGVQKRTGKTEVSRRAGKQKCQETRHGPVKLLPEEYNRKPPVRLPRMPVGSVMIHPRDVRILATEHTPPRMHMSTCRCSFAPGKAAQSLPNARWPQYVETYRAC